MANFFCLKSVISPGSGEDMCSEYNSCIYYHCANPRWMETVKVSLLLHIVSACSSLRERTRIIGKFHKHSGAKSPGQAT